MMPIVIGLHGEAGAEKDTVADMLVEHYGFRKTAFGDSLRKELTSAFQLLDLDIFSDREKKETPTSLLSLGSCDNISYAKLMTLAYFDKKTQSLDDFLNEPRSPRWTMERWGTDFRRIHQCNDNYWVDIANIFVRDSLEDGFPVVISDLRFDNEYRFIKDTRGDAWLINSNLSYSPSNHSSAKLLAVEFDKTLSNDGSPDELLAQVARSLSSDSEEADHPCP